MFARATNQKYDFSDLEETSYLETDVHSEQSPILNRVEIGMKFGNSDLKTPSRSINRVIPGSSKQAQSTLSSKFKTPSSAVRKRSLSTSCTSSSRTTNASSVIIALAEGRGFARGEMGMAAIDLKNPELILSQFPDRHTYIKTLTKLHILQPLEVIVPNTAFESGSMGGVLKLINDNFPKTATVAVQRKYFNETKGMEYIKRLGIPECKATEILISDKYYVLAATAALIKYIEFIQNIIFAAKSLNVQYNGGENTTMIDMKTCINLELLVNLNDPKSEFTLFGVLHNTKSIGGTRLLRANILQPPFCLSTTESRLDCVQEFLQTEDLLENVEMIIAKFVDVDHLLSLCVQIPKVDNIKTAEMKIGSVLQLKYTLELIQPLASALENTECPLFQSYRELLHDARYDEIHKRICEIIHLDAKHHKGGLNMKVQRCFAVQPNINGNDLNWVPILFRNVHLMRFQGLLDVARRSYAEVIEDITNLVRQLAEIHSLPLTVAYTCSKGFFIHMSLRKQSKLTDEQLPKTFIKIIKSRNSINFTTEDMMKLNGECLFKENIENNE